MGSTLLHPALSEPESSPLSPANEPVDDEQSNLDDNKQSFALCKLLNSHSSVFNALNNPELDSPMLFDSPRLRTPEVFLDQSTTQGQQSQFSITSWQSITNEFLQNSPAISRVPSNIKRVTKTSSILSTDDDLPRDYSAIIVPSPSNINAMVFDTDEEGDSEYEIPQPSFIMPKMSFSANSEPAFNKYQVAILSFSHKPEIDQLIGSLRDELSKQVNIIHINLQGEWRNTKSIMQTSNLIFIINDGSSSIVKYLNTIMDKPVEEDSQKVTIVNLITVNYFINLFELINSLRPYQIWKAASLKQDNLIDRFTSFIELECDAEDNSKQIVPKAMYYSSLISTQRQDYKVIEKQFKFDLQSSTTYNDPFKLSKSFVKLDLLFSNFKKLFVSNGGDNNMWLIYSFTMGIGFGIGMATGTMSLLGYYVYDELCGGGKIETEAILQEAPKVEFDSGSTMDKLLEGLSNARIVLEVKEFCTNYVLGFSSTVFVCIQGGLEKVISLFLSV
ncbi:uncharacterized protein SPAPADRAFT_60047 [Spathaspora passalidarum NRRL Y-27907]|uniref:Uncharacterized protein n=1 Tax=Spathaspora passalidarum (strain NRRL Y-27907 / 11-Y1) TaxID=619300 RepID=G3AJF4_SPAPN|nr:uncharacterized protein SPAPADRAFT_60047 [Spathaspora passalidarum NRRL Y-27907]EGW34613.1 hypothetical protein SPAPADRAFT_60047 [Spathaspora passalidarum NRRL Y-27907]